MQFPTLYTNGESNICLSSHSTMEETALPTVFTWDKDTEKTAKTFTIQLSTLFSTWPFKISEKTFIYILKWA